MIVEPSWFTVVASIDETVAIDGETIAIFGCAVSNEIIGRSAAVGAKLVGWSISFDGDWSAFSKATGLSAIVFDGETGE